MGDMRRSLLLPAAVACLLLAAAAIAGVGRPGAARGDTAPSQANVVTTTGHGVVTAVPDEAVVDAGVHVVAPTAAEALSRCSHDTQAVIAALKQAGGHEIQTQQVSLYPQSNPSGTVSGYTADDTVSARAKVAEAGPLVDAAVAAGANNVSGPSLDLSDRDALYRDALKKAMQDARAKAEALAGAGGFIVGPVSSVTEQSSDSGPIVLERSAAAPKAADATPVEPGTQDVTADVTVSFAIR
jgi:uncharacterized protein YggE